MSIEKKTKKRREKPNANKPAPEDHNAAQERETDQMGDVWQKGFEKQWGQPRHWGNRHWGNPKLATGYWGQEVTFYILFTRKMEVKGVGAWMRE